MAMDPRIVKELEAETPTDFHRRMLQHCKDLTRMSRLHMGKFYDHWDLYDQVYRGKKIADEQDRKAEKRDEPVKMVIPLTYAQVQTFIAFCFSTFFQRERMYEIIGMGLEDAKPAKVAEALLARDLSYNTIELKVYQMLLDVSRFGLGVVKSAWVEEKQLTKESQTQNRTFLGLSFGSKTIVQDVWKTKYAGNKLYNISPYRFFPDPRWPFARFQEGEFVASEDNMSYIQLRKLENEGQVAGIDHVRLMTKSIFELYDRRNHFTTLHDFNAVSAATLGQKMSGNHILTEVQVKLIPFDFMLQDGEPLGPEKYPIIFNVWYVNDNRVVKCEPLGYVHGLFTYDVAEINPDMHNLVNQGLAEVIDQLQSVITWLINSHITSVRKTIDNKLIVDPSGVEMVDLKERRPVIRLKQEASRSGVDKWVKQLEVKDVTQNHIADATELQGIVQIVTGINDNALGQFHTGRRSATEARSVNSATAARLKMVASLLWKGCLEPLGRKMLSNLRDGLDTETFVKVLGEQADQTTYQTFAKVTKDDLIGDYDFEVFDGTLPSERAAQAQVLQAFLTELFTVPGVLPMLGYDPRKLVDETLELAGIRNPDRFKLDQVRMQEMQAQQQQLQGIGAQNGQPQQQPGQPVGPAGNGAAGPNGSQRGVGQQSSPIISGQRLPMAPSNGPG